MKKIFSIKYLSLYAFSTDNFKRSIDEVNHLMDIFVLFFSKETLAFPIKFVHSYLYSYFSPYLHLYFKYNICIYLCQLIFYPHVHQEQVILIVLRHA